MRFLSSSYYFFSIPINFAILFRYLIGIFCNLKIIYGLCENVLKGEADIFCHFAIPIEYRQCKCRADGFLEHVQCVEPNPPMICYQSLFTPNNGKNLKPTKRFQLGQFNCDEAKGKGLYAISVETNFSTSKLLSTSKKNILSGLLKDGAFFADLLINLMSHEKGIDVTFVSAYCRASEPPDICEKKFVPDNKNETTPLYYKNLYVENIGEMQPHGNITLENITIDQNAEFLQITLLHDAIEFNKNIGSTAMEIYLNFTSDNMNISSYSSGKREYANESDILPNKNAFHRGMSLSMDIFTYKKNYTISINGKKIIEYRHRMEIWRANILRIAGNFTLKKAIVHMPKEILTKDVVFSMGLPSLLSEGDSIEISGIYTRDYRWQNFGFQFFLLHNAYGHKPEVSVRWKFSFHEGGIGCRVRHYDYNKLHITPEPFEVYEPYQNFTFYIKVGAGCGTWDMICSRSLNIFHKNWDRGCNEFLVDIVTEIFMAKYEPSFPTFALDHIAVLGDVEIWDVKMIKPNLNNRIKQIPKYSLKKGDLIQLEGTVLAIKDEAYKRAHGYRTYKTFTVKLFSKALFEDKRFGQTVLKLGFDDYKHEGNVTLSDINGEYIRDEDDEESENEDRPSAAGQKLAIKIEVLEHFYNITVSSKSKPIYTFSSHQNAGHNLPPWTVDYVVVDGDFNVDCPIEIVQN